MLLSAQNEEDLQVGVRDDVEEDTIRKIRQILFCGLPNPNLTIRN